MKLMQIDEDNRHLEAEDDIKRNQQKIQVLFIMVIYLCVVIFSKAIRDGLLGNTVNSSLESLVQVISELKNSWQIKSLGWVKIIEGITNIVESGRRFLSFVKRSIFSA